MKLISIIVPVYNVEKYLEECVKSLINQTYKNIEIILVDDGATDNSGKLCDELSLLDDRIKVIHKENEGLGLARNTGLEYTNGEYVTFIDSDDYADKELIEKLYDGIIKNNSDTCIGGFKRITDSKKVLFKEIYEYKVYSKEEVKNQLLLRMLGSSPEKSDAIRMSVWNSLYSTQIIKYNKIKFPSERKYISEDIIFDIEYYKHSNRVTIIDSCAYNYRVNALSLTQKYKKDKFEKCKFLFDEIVVKINNDSLDKTAITRLQRQYFVNLRSCIRQENSKISHKNIKSAVKTIRKICKDDHVQKNIKNYPIYKLGIKQKIFLYMVKNKMALSLYMLTKVKII